MWGRSGEGSSGAITFINSNARRHLRSIVPAAVEMVKQSQYHGTTACVIMRLKACAEDGLGNLH